MSNKNFWRAALIALTCMGATPAFSAPIIGGQWFALGGDVTVTVEASSAGYVSELWLYQPGPDIFVALNRNTGATVSLGSFAAGTELVFGIFVRDTGHTFYMGPGSRNADGVAHASVNVIGPGEAIVAFEDLWGGGDLDFNDNIFRFFGAGPQLVVPEPGALVLSVIALAALGSTRKRR